MTTRTRRTAAEIAIERRAIADVAEAKAKKIEDAGRNRRIYIGGSAIQAMAAAGDEDCERAWNKMLAGLVRKQDRLAFGLEPLPVSRPDDQQPVNPPESPDLTAAKLRLDRAVEVFNVDVKSPPGPHSARLRSDLIEAIVGFEKLSGEVWDGLKDPKGREAFGFTDRPGELAKAS